MGPPHWGQEELGVMSWAADVAVLVCAGSEPGVQGKIAPIAAEATAEFDRLRSAVTSTLQHAQIGAPRTDCVAILVGHHAR